MSFLLSALEWGQVQRFEEMIFPQLQNVASSCMACVCVCVCICISMQIEWGQLFGRMKIPVEWKQESQYFMFLRWKNINCVNGLHTLNNPCSDLQEEHKQLSEDTGMLQCDGALVVLKGFQNTIELSFLSF